jgi:hypothetical protein
MKKRQKLTGPSDEVYRRVLDALHFKREHPRISLAKAAAAAGTTPRTVTRYAKGAIYKRGARLRVKSSDRLHRDLIFYDSKGPFTLTTRSSRQASEIAKYHNAVRAYVIYGDDSALQNFDGKSITVHGKPYRFVTDRRTLNRFARAGELRFLDIYKDGGPK